MKKIVRDKNNSFLKFLFIGGTSTFIDFIIYLLLTTKLDIMISKILSMLVASVFAYIFNKKWTFMIQKKTNIILVSKYIFCQIINISVNVLVNTTFYYLLSLKIVSFVFATGIAMLVNYLLQRFWVFRTGGDGV